MKKRQIWLLIAVLCCLCLWIWLYIGKSNNTPTSKLTEDKFDKQAQCVALYPSIKEYLTDQYTRGEANKQKDYAKVNNVEVWYSSKVDWCVAYLDWSLGKYGYTLNGEDYYQYTFTQSLFNVNDWYSTLARCDFSGTQNGDCRTEFDIEMYSYKD